MQKSSGPLRFGTAVVPGPQATPTEVTTWARHLEDAGFDLLGVADSPSLYPELLVSLSAVAEATTAPTVATWVTNPLLRHPLALAAGVVAAAARAPGRVHVGLGTGDSALHNAGLRPAPLSVTADFLNTVRELLTTGSSTWEGRPCHLRTASGPPPRLLLAASGPRGLHVAGMVADGVIVGGGIDDRSIEQTLERIAEGARAAGRDISALDIWWNIKVAVGTDREEAIDDIAYALAARAHYAFRHTLGDVPRSLRPAIGELVERYMPLDHGVIGRATNGRLVRDLGLGEFLADRFAVAGTATDCVDRLRAASRLGLTNVFTMLQRRELGGTDPFVTEVMPRLRDAERRSEKLSR